MKVAIREFVFDNGLPVQFTVTGYTSMTIKTTHADSPCLFHVGGCVTKTMIFPGHFYYDVSARYQWCIYHNQDILNFFRKNIDRVYGNKHASHLVTSD